MNKYSYLKNEDDGWPSQLTVINGDKPTFFLRFDGVWELVDFLINHLSQNPAKKHDRILANSVAFSCAT